MAITTQQIEALHANAGQAGDVVQAAICKRAQGWEGRDLADYEMSDAERARVLGMTQDEARTECERAISNARAMED